MVDVFLRLYLTNILFFSLVICWLVFFCLRKVVGVSFSTAFFSTFLAIMMYFILSYFQYQNVRKVFDGTKEDVVLKVITSDGMGLESLDGERYIPTRGKFLGIQFLYLFNEETKPEVGRCVRVELNYYVYRKKGSYINFGNIYKVDCVYLMNSREVGEQGEKAMKNRWIYKQLHGHM